MNKKIIAVASAVALILSVNTAWAKPTFTPSTVRPSGQTVQIPEMAVEVLPNVFSIGTSVDPQTGKTVEGLAIIHYKKGFSHKPQRGGGGATSPCYSFLSRGAKWKSVEPWVVNTANTAGLSSSFVFNTLEANVTKWEDAADGAIGNGVSKNILGVGSTTTDTLVADEVSPDGVNETYFADISSPGAIAVTIVWGYFGGPPQARELVEWDMVFDDVDFDWSATGESGKMDFENIDSHEKGHGVGLGHPDDSCTEETMHRFASLGETKKRSLEVGDIAGVSQLYK